MFLIIAHQCACIRRPLGDRPRSLVVRAPARSSGGRGLILDRVTPKTYAWEVCASQLGAWHYSYTTNWPTRSQYNSLSDSTLLICGRIGWVVWYPKIAWRGPIVSKRQLQINSPHLHVHLYTAAYSPESNLQSVRG